MYSGPRRDELFGAVLTPGEAWSVVIAAGESSIIIETDPDGRQLAAQYIGKVIGLIEDLEHEGAVFITMSEVLDGATDTFRNEDGKLDKQTATDIDVTQMHLAFAYSAFKET